MLCESLLHVGSGVCAVCICECTAFTCRSVCALHMCYESLLHVSSAVCIGVLRVGVCVCVHSVKVCTFRCLTCRCECCV